MWVSYSCFVSLTDGSDSNKTSLVTDEEKAKMQVVFSRMMQKYPKWKVSISPENSVKRILMVVKDSKVD